MFRGFHQILTSYSSSSLFRLSSCGKFFSSSVVARDGEAAVDLMGIASQVVIAKNPEEKLSLLLKGHQICESCSPSSLAILTPSNNSGVEYDAPGRPDKPELVHPTKMLTHKKLKVPLQIYLLHSLAHIELNAIDIASDMVARFAPGMPLGFACDWFEVAYEEGVHFQLLCERLKQLNYSYGDLPGHDGLWRAADSTKEDLVGRLVAIPLVQEARALDSKERLNKKMVSCADAVSAKLVEKICDEEIKHVKYGVKWLNYIAEQRNTSAKLLYQEGVLKYTGKVVGPFNVESRTEAGMPTDWYQQTVTKN